MSLTSKKIDALQPRESRYTVSDTHGLALRVHPTGTKSWVLRMSFNGRVSDLTLGKYPEVSLKQARQLARNKRKEIGLEAPNGYTFRDAFKLWCSLKKGEIVSYHDEKMRIEKYLMAPLGNRQLDEISAPLIIYTVKHLSSAGKLATLKRVLMRAREIVDLGVCAGFVKNNPLERVSRVFPAPKTVSMPSIHWKELERAMGCFVGQDKGLQLLFLFSCLSALRPCENAKLQWDWIDDEMIRIPADEMKKGREHRVPLTAEMQLVLSECKKLNRGRKYVFEGRKAGSHVSSAKLAKFLRTTELGGVLVAHGLRSIARTWMTDTDVRFEVAEACLSHVVGSAVSRTYQRSDYFEQRKVVMADWNAYVWLCAEKAGLL